MASSRNRFRFCFIIFEKISTLFTGAALNDVWPTFWTGSIVGWAGFVKVDGKAYSFLGAPNVPGATFTKATQKSLKPSDLVKQSIPFSYFAISASSTDGTSHSVQIYSDISAEWVSGDNGLVANWTTATGSILTHQIQLQSPSLLSENIWLIGWILDGSAYYSTPNAFSATFQTGGDVTVRAQFINTGRLPNTKDTNFRGISNNWPVFAFAHDLGSVTGATVPVVVSVGHVRDPAIKYIVAGGGTQLRSLYFWSKYATIADLISSFLGDYNNALATSTAYDNKVNSDASKISADYAAIVNLSVRQLLGAIEITIAKNSDGTWNTGDPLVYMKEISSDGNMNTVDVIFPAWPGILYANPLLGKYLLEVLYRYQASGLYPNKWSVHDIGSGYPNALGHNDGNDEAMPVEESGNMLIMALSYAQKTGDKSQLTQYNKLHDQWTQFLIEDSLIPAQQLSTDDFAGHLANQTNLAIKGIIGIKAMSEISKLLGDTARASNYSAIATDYVNRWQTLAASNTGKHLTLSYNDHASWGLAYNLYAEKLLKLNLFPASIYTLQTAWYKTVARKSPNYPAAAVSPGLNSPHPIPQNLLASPWTLGEFSPSLSPVYPMLTSLCSHTYTKTDWQIYTAAIMTDTTARDLFIGSVKKFAAAGTSDQPFGDWYETTNGRAEGFRARPVVGGHLGKTSLETITFASWVRADF
ncbi:hypothetical protein H0H81_006779 [Sphagnurus paluster]|uniref:DUF1793-domain-containing protein n=1 Tax=Sphagnurus paluster TaxID=117069 RepID=A0A9P7GLF4_9AGAR|nr:hypothetical protein H0H81_006779 [Sphagnurus paluster]